MNWIFKTEKSQDYWYIFRSKWVLGLLLPLRINLTCRKCICTTLATLCTPQSGGNKTLAFWFPFCTWIWCNCGQVSWFLNPVSSVFSEMKIWRLFFKNTWFLSYIWDFQVATLLREIWEFNEFLPITIKGL